MENKSVFNCFLNCLMLLLSCMFLGSLFHRVGPAQANARRPKRSRLTLGTSSSNPPAERSERGGVWRRSSAAKYYGVPLYMALCTSTSSLKLIRFLTGNQCNCRSIVVMDCRSMIKTIQVHSMPNQPISRNLSRLPSPVLIKHIAIYNIYNIII